MSKRFVLLMACAFAAACAVPGASLVPVAGAGFSIEPINGKPNPVWSGGAMLSLDSYFSASPVVSIANAQGIPAGIAVISIPGAKTVSIRCVARGGDGTVVAGGWASTEDGRIAEILAVIPPGGANVNITRIDPFASKQLAVAPDGSIWAQGFIGRNRDNIPDTDPLHGIIRHFDRTGKPMGSFLPEAKLDNRLREMTGHLAVSGDRAGWISWVQNPKGGISGGYVEISADGSVQEYPLPAMAVIKGFAITDTGVPVAGVVIERGRPGSSERSAMMALNRERRMWSVLDVPGSPSLAGKTFLGGSGSTLAIWDLKSRLVSFFNAE